jgi:3-isopropylmalate dehydrogenase
MFLSAAMMLEWLALRHQDPVLLQGANLIEKALESAFQSGAVLPYDFGGRSNTQDIAHAVIARLESN